MQIGLSGPKVAQKELSLPDVIIKADLYICFVTIKVHRFVTAAGRSITKQSFPTQK
jgi:hypothetical protein